MSEQQAVVVVESLKIQFPEMLRPAVADLSFEIPAGKTLAIVGESGSGKSLTALALMGLLPRNAEWSGRIELNSVHGNFQIDSVTDESDWQGLRGEVLSLVFQEPMNALNPVMRIGRQLKEAITTHGKGRGRAARALALEWLGKVQLPDPERIYHRYPHQLSGGQKQRVLIAMALCGHPAVLIADEPTTALDVIVQREILSLIRELQQETGTALIFITHDLSVAAELADDVLVLREGKIQEYGPAEKVLNIPESTYTKVLLGCRPGTAEKGKRLPVVSDFSGGSAPAESPLPTLRPGAQTLLKVRHLRIWYPGAGHYPGRPGPVIRAVEDVSFDLLRGEVLGLVGESGCGKSSLSRALVGLQSIESGSIEFDGTDLVHLSAAGWKRMRRKVQMIFQDPYAAINPRLTIGDQLQEVLSAHRIVRRSELKNECARLMELVELPADSLKRYPHQFSGGQRQRIGIARALALRPQLIICDESVSALDLSVQAQILNLLKSLQAELKLSYLFISHDLNVVHYMSDHVLVMQAGRIVERGTAEAVLRYPEHEYTRRLIEAMPH